MEKTPDSEDMLTQEKVSCGTISILSISLLGVNRAIHARSHYGALYPEPLHGNPTRFWPF